MKNTLTLTAALLMTTTFAHAGAIDRGQKDLSVLFEDGNYVKLSFTAVQPDVTGDFPTALGGGSTGNMAEDFETYGLALKYDINEQFAIGLFFNQPFGADASYEQGVFDGLNATWDSDEIALVVKYQATPNFSFYGGVRTIETDADIAIPDSVIRGRIGAAAQAAGAAGDLGTAQALGGIAQNTGLDLNYDAQTDKDRQTSYLIGAAYERPEIALRVGLTYDSGYTHDFEGTESLAGLGLDATQDFEIEMPESVTLDFQSGVAADTLIFGSIRWANWSVWDVRPAGFESVLNDEVTSIEDDVITYRIGIGRQVNEDLSVFARVTFENDTNGSVSLLAPTDGRLSLGVGGTYAYNGVDFTGGIEYVSLGDVEDESGVEFADNDAIALGLSIGYAF